MNVDDRLGIKGVLKNLGQAEKALDKALLTFKSLPTHTSNAAHVVETCRLNVAIASAMLRDQLSKREG